MRHAATAMLFGMALVGGGAAAEPLSDEAQIAAAPRAVKEARTRVIPRCTVYVDAAFTGAGAGTVARPHKTIAAAVKAALAGAIICVAEGVYAEQLKPGAKPFTLAGGFQRGKAFKVRDSFLYRSKAQGRGGSFIRIADIGPTGSQLTAIDGFEITGYSQAIYRDFYVSQRFDITNNLIHGNVCSAQQLAGAGFALVNVSGTIRGNVIRKNRCWRGGAGFINDSLDENNVAILNNLIQDNAGTEPQNAHGGALYLFNNRLTITGNEFTGNTVTGWGAGLYLGAYTAGGQHTYARLSWNVYRNNRAGIYGGGMFCDDSARCTSDHELYDRNCGGNVYVDGASGTQAATIAKFDHMTNVNARAVGCGAPGPGVQIDHDIAAPDTTTITNSLFSGNAPGADLVASCGVGCAQLNVNVSWSMVQRKYVGNGGAKVIFGSGILAPRDPRFVNPAARDFHLKSTAGHFRPTGIVKDAVSSSLLAKGNPSPLATLNPACAGTRTELGAYGNSREASCVP
jgi:hypothetical protein